MIMELDSPQIIAFPTASSASSSPLKKGTGSDLTRVSAGENDHCEVPVPLFQRAARVMPYPSRDCSSRRAVIVSSYATGAPKGKNLGTPGYSYDFVVRLFAPLIQRWGNLTVVPREKVEAAVAQARSRGLAPVHLSFLPLQDVCLASDAPNIVVPAWEYPDIPDHAFDLNPQNNWVETASRCDSLIVGGPFTVAAFRRAGVRVPIHTVQVPTPDDYFQIPAWMPGREIALSFPGQTFSCPTPTDDVIERRTLRLLCRDLASPRRWANRFVSASRFVYRRTIGMVLPKHVHNAMKEALSNGLAVWRDTPPNAFRSQRKSHRRSNCSIFRASSIPASSIRKIIGRTGRTC